MFHLTADLLSCRRIAVLAATVVLGATGAMAGAGPATAATIAPAHSAGGLGLFGGTTTVSVPATTGPASPGVPGVDTGIYLEPGEGAMITATGMATCNARNPVSECVYLNANGGGSAVGASPPFFDPGAPAYSLTGEVGGGPLTFVGTGPVTVDGPGELRLGYNDELGDYSDNGGAFTVTIQTCTLYGLPILGGLLCSLLS